ncbi:MAG: ATP-binding cassette domain-containing protein [Rhodobacteraceae bacterium]|nr:ATP-binding cassette domain-containing protein [Paracoccaceae bacterium]
MALAGVSMHVNRGEVLCLLGDNGAGKSTLIKTLSGVYAPTEGEILMNGKPVRFLSPRDALDRGIATVHQTLALIPLMSIMRNFFMGREPLKFVLGHMDIRKANRIARRELRNIGIDVRDPSEAVGKLSGGERQCVAIARAVYFGARVLILDEPTSALGVHQTATVLRYIKTVRDKGLSVIFITHNVHHALTVGDRFTVLNRGRTIGTWRSDQITLPELEKAMAGGRALQELSRELGRTV